jgi:predicted sugar kinase
MQLLPALVEDELPSFGSALSTIQRITGSWFAAEQGGVFAPGRTEQLVAEMATLGAVGVGQSSWGPAVYGLLGSTAASAALARRIQQSLGGNGQVFEGGFAAHGARVWTGGRDPGID